MTRSPQTQVSHAIDAWLKWIPLWQPGTHRGRVAPCRRCLGSPVLIAAGLDVDIPHGVQHGFSIRIKTVVDRSVHDYVWNNLPVLQAELDQQAERNRARSYRPTENLDPEFEGLPLDPDPVPGAPFLFTLSGLAEQENTTIPDLVELAEDHKEALRREMGLADEYAQLLGREVCAHIADHRDRIHDAVVRFVQPQVDRMLAELTSSLDTPFDIDGYARS